VLEHLRTIAPNVHVVAGDMDDPALGLPEEKIVEIGAFRIGLIHGHQVVPWGDPEALANLQRKMDVDILVTGHTHKSEVLEHEGLYIVNPGSASGAHSAIQTSVRPTFILMAIRGARLVTYVYELKGDKVSVLKSEFLKAGAAASS